MALTDAHAPDGASFTMGTQDVRIQAVFAEDVPIRFTDVVPGSYYEEAVNWAVRNGITNGTTATTFEPEATCTRAQIVTFLWRALAR